MPLGEFNIFTTGSSDTWAQYGPAWLSSDEDDYEGDSTHNSSALVLPERKRQRQDVGTDHIVDNALIINPFQESAAHPTISVSTGSSTNQASSYEKNVTRETMTLANNPNTSPTEVPLPRIEIIEDVYLLILQGKLQAIGINTKSLIPGQTFDIQVITPLAIQQASNELQSQDAWMAMVQILQNNPNYVRVLTLLGETYLAQHQQLTTRLNEEQINRLVRLWFQLLPFHCQQFEECRAPLLQDNTLIYVESEPTEDIQRIGTSIGRDREKHFLAICLSLKALRYTLYYAVQSIRCQFYAEDMSVLVQCLRCFSKDCEVILLVGAVLKNYPMNVESVTKQVECGMIEVLTEILTGLDHSIPSAINVLKFILPELRNLAELEGNYSRFENAGTSAVLIELLKEYRDHETIVKKVCLVIGSLCISTTESNCREVFYQLKVCELLIELLPQFETKLLTFTAICRVIRYMAQHPDAKSFFSNCQFAQTSGSDQIANSVNTGTYFINMLTIHIKQATIVEQICGAMSHLATIAKNHQTFLSLGIDKMLSEVLREHVHQANVMETTCALIWGLAENDPRNVPQQETAEGNLEPLPEYVPTIFASSDSYCETLVHIFKELKSVPSLVRQLCGALYQICKNDSKHQKQMVQCGVRLLLFESLQRYHQEYNQRDLIYSVLTLDLLLLAGIDTSTRTVAEEKIAVLLKILHIHSMDIELIEIICKLFVTLLKNPSNISLFYVSAISTVIGLLNTHKGIESTVIEILSVLQRTGIYFNLLNTTHGCHSLLLSFEEVLLIYMDKNQTIVNPICALIRSLGIPALNQMDLTSTRFCPLVLELLVLHIESSETVIQLISLIGDTCAQKYVVAKKFVEEKVVLTLFDTCQIHLQDVSVMKTLCYVLKGLTSYYHIVQNILNTNKIYDMLEMILPIYRFDFDVMQELIVIVLNMMRFDLPKRQQQWQAQMPPPPREHTGGRGSGRSRTSGYLTPSVSKPIRVEPVPVPVTVDEWSLQRMKQSFVQLQHILTESLEFFQEKMKMPEQFQTQKVESPQDQEEMSSLSKEDCPEFEDFSKLIEDINMALTMLTPISMATISLSPAAAAAATAGTTAEAAPTPNCTIM